MIAEVSETGGAPLESIKALLSSVIHAVRSAPCSELLLAIFPLTLCPPMGLPRSVRHEHIT